MLSAYSVHERHDSNSHLPCRSRASSTLRAPECRTRVGRRKSLPISPALLRGEVGVGDKNLCRFLRRYCGGSRHRNSAGEIGRDFCLPPSVAREVNILHSLPSSSIACHQVRKGVRSSVRVRQHPQRSRLAAGLALIGSKYCLPLNERKESSQTVRSIMHEVQLDDQTTILTPQSWFHNSHYVSYSVTHAKPCEPISFICYIMSMHIQIFAGVA